MSRQQHKCSYCEMDLSRLEVVGKHIDRCHTKELLADVKTRMEKRIIARSIKTPVCIMLDGYKSVYKCLGCSHISISEKSHIDHVNTCEVHQTRLTKIVNDINENSAKSDLIELNERFVKLENEWIEQNKLIEKLKSERLSYKIKYEEVEIINETFFKENKDLKAENEQYHKENKALLRKNEILMEENTKYRTAKPLRQKPIDVDAKPVVEKKKIPVPEKKVDASMESPVEKGMRLIEEEKKQNAQVEYEAISQELYEKERILRKVEQQYTVEIENSNKIPKDNYDLIATVSEHLRQIHNRINSLSNDIKTLNKKKDNLKQQYKF